MKKIILMGRSGSGKTTLTQRLKNIPVNYSKTQYISNDDFVIDTPGEYAQTRYLGCALALYSYEADVVGLLLSAAEQYSIYSPNITCMANRQVIGIVTQTDRTDANPDRAAEWLRLAGCEKIFFISSKTGQGIQKLKDFLQI